MVYHSRSCRFLEIENSANSAVETYYFDYIWEVYKSLPQRKWGYYVLPVLWGDRLVARFEPKLNRKSNTLVICGGWLEDVIPAALQKALLSAAKLVYGKRGDGISNKGV